jgi:hypothetical protein
MSGDFGGYFSASGALTLRPTNASACFSIGASKEESRMRSTPRPHYRVTSIIVHFGAVPRFARGDPTGHR